MKFNLRLLLGICFSLLLSSNFIGFAYANAEVKNNNIAPDIKTTTGNKVQKNCPILGNPISKNTYIDYKGKRIYFCCPGCEKDFKKDAEKYIHKLRAEGIKLEDSPSPKK